ncbi:hypothetical protein EMIHUDRAFT_211648 [Emiliania huxleyi CCMP1516]|uniref:F-box domain-containing protein n=2 Tax=Emiliania huxleyi TaxID=2903 RepID=A0A0D3IVZ6_EMIH1|nr:hypothetical protein EMIHUDRAFT_211648 [Emiliania huxleyi CCMP1516]EOD15431.1 hypothetical protein EMIHUDRAFT_211648 [Emiliania huxleyi CCMP1516]|eukprot:XP_005767860.1 hypothetical protein EMIHUDRAFT_211648 [Emiliania huxleyi CCMP1516]
MENHQEDLLGLVMLELARRVDCTPVLTTSEDSALLAHSHVTAGPPLLHDLPLDLQAKILSLTEPPAFAALRRCDCRHREAADAAVAHMLAQLRAAVAAYASADHCRVLRHCRLTSWPITSCAIAVVLPATEWAELLSPAVHLLEHWLRAELCDCLQRLKRIAALHAGKGSTLAALRHLHARSVLRFETWQQSVVPLGLECECSIGALGGSQHLDSVCAGEPSPLGPAAQRLLADALFTSAFGMHHRASSDADAERAVASYRQCSYLLQHALAIQEEQLAAGSIQELTVLCTRLALAQAAAGRGDLRAAREALEALLPAMRSTLGAALALVRRAFDERWRALGPLHEDTCRTAQWLHGVLIDLEPPARAASLAPFLRCLRSLLADGREAARLAVALTPHFQRSHFSFEVPVEMVHWLSDGDPRRRRSDCGDLPRSTFYGQCRWDEAPLPLDGLLGRRDPESARMRRNLGCPDLVALVEDAAEEEPSAEVW